jgi:hypothetical protein
MKLDYYNLKTIVELAKEIETEDPIDWSNLNVDKNLAYNIIASQVIELMKQSDDMIKTTTIVKLIVENFVLNLKLQRLQ